MKYKRYKRASALFFAFSLIALMFSFQAAAYRGSCSQVDSEIHCENVHNGKWEEVGGYNTCVECGGGGGGECTTEEYTIDSNELGESDIESLRVEPGDILQNFK